MPTIEDLCSFSECDQPSRTTGLCVGHYKQSRRGMDLRALRASASLRDELGRKRCARCEEWREVNHFTQNLRQSDSLDTWCVDCCAVYRASEGFVANTLMRTYSLTLERYNELLADQAGVCGSCKRAEPRGGRLSVDHDHACCAGSKSCGRCVRGLLCRRCNLMLGHAGDSKDVFVGLIEYLNQFT